MRYIIPLFIIFTVFLFSCEKWEDKPGAADDRLQKRYCNDPLAVNYNWDFPGTPDNSLCFYPTDVFEGTYELNCANYYSDEFKFKDSTKNKILTIVRKSSNKFELVGFCSDKAIPFTADRFYKATVDSIQLADSTFLGGQLLCRPQDTLSGFITRNKDSATITISFRIGTDTNVLYHMGAAKKQ